MSANMGRLEPGTAGVYKGRTDWLVGLKLKVVRQSRRTGMITVEILEDRKPYTVGHQLHIMPYEFELS